MANNTNTMPELRAKAEGLCIQYNDLFGDAKFAEAKKVKDDLTQTVNEYTGLARRACFEQLKASGDPMIAAIKQMDYPSIAVKDAAEKDDALPKLVIEDRMRPIDLLKLDKYCKGIGADTKWASYAMKLNYLLTYRTCIKIGVKNPAETIQSFAMSEIAKQVKLGATPTSNTQLLKALQKVIDTMIGPDYKATSHDVEYLLSTYSKRGKKALTVVTSNNRALVRILMDNCHHLVTGEYYSVEFQKSKDNASSQVTITKAPKESGKKTTTGKASTKKTKAATEGEKAAD